MAQYPNIKEVDLPLDIYLLIKNYFFSRLQAMGKKKKSGKNSAPQVPIKRVCTHCGDAFSGSFIRYHAHLCKVRTEDSQLVNESLCLYASLFFCPSVPLVPLFLCPSVPLVPLFLCPSVPIVPLFLCPSCSSVPQFLCPSVYLFLCPSVPLSLCSSILMLYLGLSKKHFKWQK